MKSVSIQPRSWPDSRRYLLLLPWNASPVAVVAVVTAEAVVTILTIYPPEFVSATASKYLFREALSGKEHSGYGIRMPAARILILLVKVPVFGLLPIALPPTLCAQKALTMRRLAGE